MVKVPAPLNAIIFYGAIVAVSSFAVLSFVTINKNNKRAAESSVDYEFIAPLPEAGVYKFYDIPEQKVCYLLYSTNGRSAAMSCEAVHPDLQADPSTIRE